MDDVRLGDLGPARPLSSGGQGAVYRLSRPGLLLKLYHDTITVRGDELTRLITLPRRFPPADRHAVGRLTAWPAARVVDRGRCVGLLMREAPSRFATTLAGRRRLLELQFLLYRPRPMWRELALPAADERRRLAVRYARLFQVLHDNGVLVGDVSMRNLLWSVHGGPAVFALDCDSFRIVGRPAAIGRADTDGWADPAVRPGEATADTDRYKLALVVLRLLLGDHAAGPADHAVDDLDRPLRVLAGRAVRPGGRPPAGDWLAALAAGAGLMQPGSGMGAHARVGSGGPGHRSPIRR